MLESPYREGNPMPEEIRPVSQQMNECLSIRNATRYRILYSGLSYRTAKSERVSDSAR